MLYLDSFESWRTMNWGERQPSLLWAGNSLWAWPCHGTIRDFIDRKAREQPLDTFIFGFYFPCILRRQIVSDRGRSVQCVLMILSLARNASDSHRGFVESIPHFRLTSLRNHLRSSLGAPREVQKQISWHRPGLSFYEHWRRHRGKLSRVTSESSSPYRPASSVWN